MAKVHTFEYNLEETKQKIFNCILLIREYENYFSLKAERAEANSKDGFWTTNHEHTCTVKSYQYTERELTTSFQVLVHSIQHMGIQKSVQDQIIYDQQERIRQLESYVKKLTVIANVDLIINDCKAKMEGRKSA